MPIYEYACKQCGKLNEVLQKVTDPAPAKCEGCGAEGTLSKIVSRSSFVLKGGGWYSDLYASSGGKKGGSESSTASSSSSSSTAASTPAAAPSTSSPAGSTSGSGGGGAGGSGPKMAAKAHD